MSSEPDERNIDVTVFSTLYDQACQESRYFRQFHHTLFSIFTGFYLTILGFQIANPEVISQIEPWTQFIVCLVLFVWLPLYVVYIIFKYHIAFAVKSAAVYALTKGLLALADTDNAPSMISKEQLASLLAHSKYYDKLSRKKNPAFIGRGHLFFALVILGVDLCNILLYVNYTRLNPWTVSIISVVFVIILGIRLNSTPPISLKPMAPDAPAEQAAAHS